jgi:hypothetical protein
MKANSLMDDTASPLNATSTAELREMDVTVPWSMMFLHMHSTHSRLLTDDSPLQPLQSILNLPSADIVLCTPFFLESVFLDMLFQSKGDGIKRGS